jgi:hypothetical protein
LPKNLPLVTIHLLALTSKQILKVIPMAKKVVFGLLYGAVLAGAPGVYAQAVDASKSGSVELRPYIQGAVGVQRLSSPKLTGMAMDLNGSKESTSVRATVGLQLTERIGVEASWFQLPSTTLRTNSGDATYKGEVYTLSVAASMPIHKGFDLVGRIGIGQSNVDVSVPATTYKSNSRQDSTVWGLSLRYALDKSKDVSIDYDNLGAVGKYALGDRVKADMISFGLRFKF